MVVSHNLTSEREQDTWSTNEALTGELLVSWETRAVHKNVPLFDDWELCGLNPCTFEKPLAAACRTVHFIPRKVVISPTVLYVHRWHDKKRNGQG